MMLVRMYSKYKSVIGVQLWLDCARDLTHNGPSFVCGLQQRVVGWKREKVKAKEMKCLVEE
jgi:hypothetical protein